MVAVRHRIVGIETRGPDCVRDHNLQRASTVLARLRKGWRVKHAEGETMGRVPPAIGMEAGSARWQPVRED